MAEACRVQLAAYTPHQLRDGVDYLWAFWVDRGVLRQMPPERRWVSHVEVVVDGVCYSSGWRDGRARAKLIDLDKPHWKVIPAPWADAERALRQFRRYAGRPYGLADVVSRCLLGLPVEARGLGCSELAAKMLGLTGSGVGRHPAELAEYCELRAEEKA